MGLRETRCVFSRRAERDRSCPSRARVHQPEQHRKHTCCRLRASCRSSVQARGRRGGRRRSCRPRIGGDDVNLNEGRPHVADHLVNGDINLVINTPLGRDSFFDDRAVRRAATMAQVPCITTLTGASAAVSAIRALRSQTLTVRSLQAYYSRVEAKA